MLGDLTVHLGRDRDTWRGQLGRMSLSDLSLGGVLLLDFCSIRQFISLPGTRIFNSKNYKSILFSCII